VVQFEGEHGIQSCTSCNFGVNLLGHEKTGVGVPATAALTLGLAHAVRVVPACAPLLGTWLRRTPCLSQGGWWGDRSTRLEAWWFNSEGSMGSSYAPAATFVVNVPLDPVCT
jgi:hypothetical protein